MLKLNKKHIFLVLILILAFSLRFYHLTQNPPGLYWDEASLGYNAYSILKTGRDEHGRFLPLFFESFGDWKMPLYVYLDVPFIFFFGLSEFAVRFPSALFGVLTVFIFYLLIRKIFPKDHLLALLATFFLAVSPWHLQFSRAAFEANVALFFNVLGLYLFVLFLEKKNFLIFLSFLSFVLSIYTYHQGRIFLPLLAIGFLVFYFRKLTPAFKKIILASSLTLLLLAPVIKFSLSKEGRTRYLTQPAFTHENFKEARIDLDQRGPKFLRPNADIFYQKPFYYSYIFFNSYFDHFSAVFFFFRGDFIERHSVQEMGQMYPFELLTVFLGIWIFWKKKEPFLGLLLIWLFLAPIPAALVKPTPHAVRSLPMVIPLSVFSAAGLLFFWGEIRKRLGKTFPLIFYILLLLALAVSWATYLHIYFSHYPQKYGPTWQEGYKDLMAKLKNYDNFNLVQISSYYGFPYIYHLFYSKVDPAFYQKEGSPQKIGRFEFVELVPRLIPGQKNLYVGPSLQTIEQPKVDEVKSRFDRSVFTFWELK